MLGWRYEAAFTDNDDGRGAYWCIRERYELSDGCICHSEPILDGYETLDGMRADLKAMLDACNEYVD